MKIAMRRSEFDALPDRSTLGLDPIEGQSYRDPTSPNDVFVCESARPARWSCFSVDVMIPDEV